MSIILFGWVGRARTCECGSQSPVPYHLATTHCDGHKVIDAGPPSYLYKYLISILRAKSTNIAFILLYYFCAQRPAAKPYYSI